MVFVLQGDLYLRAPVELSWFDTRGLRAVPGTPILELEKTLSSAPSSWSAYIAQRYSSLPLENARIFLWERIYFPHSLFHITTEATPLAHFSYRDGAFAEQREDVHGSWWQCGLHIGLVGKVFGRPDAYALNR
jgi:hypothetical protein